jgi:hypothetical protein
VVIEAYLEKLDPVRKAKRLCPDTVPPTPPAIAGVRTPTPAPVRHLVNQRDQGQCVFTDKNGSRCTERRWLVLHHRIHVADGGPNSATNLDALCQGHHRYLHTTL